MKQITKTMKQTESHQDRKRITKTYKTMKQAESYQNRLYNQYEHVQLVSFPRFEEEGVYVWEVK